MRVVVRTVRLQDFKPTKATVEWSEMESGRPGVPASSGSRGRRGGEGSDYNGGDSMNGTTMWLKGEFSHGNHDIRAN